MISDFFILLFHIKLNIKLKEYTNLNAFETDLNTLLLQTSKEFEQCFNMLNNCSDCKYKRLTKLLLRLKMPNSFLSKQFTLFLCNSRVLQYFLSFTSLK